MSWKSSYCLLSEIAEGEVGGRVGLYPLYLVVLSWLTHRPMYQQSLVLTLIENSRSNPASIHLLELVPLQIPLLESSQ